MFWILVIALGGLVLLAGLSGMEEDARHRAWQRKMKRLQDEGEAAALRNKDVPTDWSRYLPLSHQEQRERDLWRERARWTIHR